MAFILTYFVNSMNECNIHVIYVESDLHLHSGKVLC
jgi:hypothetical protein